MSELGKEAIDKEEIFNIIGFQRRGSTETETTEGKEGIVDSITDQGESARKRKRRRPPGSKNKVSTEADIRVLFENQHKGTKEEGERANSTEKKKEKMGLGNSDNDSSADESTLKEFMDQNSSLEEDAGRIKRRAKGEKGNSEVEKKEEKKLDESKGGIGEPRGMSTPKMNFFEEMKKMMGKVGDEMSSMRKEREEDKEERRENRRELVKISNKIQEFSDKWNEDRKMRMKVEGDILEELRKHEDRISKLEKKRTEGAQESNDALKNEEVQRLRWRMEQEERKGKRNNIVITGIKLENQEEISDWLKVKFGCEVERRKIWKIRGAEDKWGVELREYEAKIELMKKKKALAGIKIYIDNDLTWQERRVKDKLMEMASKIREKGGKAKVGYNKLIEDGKVFIWNEREERFFRNERRSKSQSKGE